MHTRAKEYCIAGLCIALWLAAPRAPIAQQDSPAGEKAHGTAIREAAPVTAPMQVATPEPGVEQAGDTAANLPVRRVVLYKSGVGYFEHLGKVSGDQTVAIDFTSGQ